MELNRLSLNTPSSKLSLNTPPSEPTAVENAATTDLAEAGLAAATVSLSRTQGRPPPPADHGREAYMFLAACFILEALVWGLPFTYGVFQEHYSTHEPFQGSGNIAIIGTSALGILYLDLPIVFAILQADQRYLRMACLSGVLMMALALATSSFATSVAHLIVTQGILYGIGGSISYSTCLILIEEWFDKRKGFAFGIMLAGTGCGGTILPIVTEQLLGRYGFRTTLRAFSVAILVLSGPFVYYMRPRLPVSHRPLLKRINIKFMKTPTFALLWLCNTIQGLGFFLPSIYLPSYARSIGASQSVGALAVVVCNVASVLGCVLMGFIIDRYHVTTCSLISTIGATIGIFLIWGFATSLPALFIFAVEYGIFAGSWVATWPGIVRAVTEKTDSADPSTVLAWVATARGIGNVASGPLSEAFLRGSPWKGQVGYGYGSGYGTLIVFTGITALLSGGSFVGRKVGWI